MPVRRKTTTQFLFLGSGIPSQSVSVPKCSRIGATNKNWEVAYCMFVVALNTTCGEGEIRHLRRMDIDPIQRTLRISEGAKNDGRRRVIPLNQTAWNAVLYLLNRAERLGSTRPEHYLMPFRVRTRTHDPDRPMLTCRVALREMLVAAGVSNCSFYSFRHHAITGLL